MLNCTIRVEQTGADGASKAFPARFEAALRKALPEVKVSVVSRANNDIAVYTDSGVTLFDRSPRTVAFDTTNLSAGVEGNAVTIDGRDRLSGPHLHSESFEITHRAARLRFRERG